jgi:cyclophilin family peptidyl-prolyl cis-trans isomerase/HEAT repeat protein
MIRHRLNRLLRLAALPALLATTPLLAQEASVEIMASIMAAEDARSFDEGLLRSGLADPDSSIRGFAAQSAGRLRDSRAIPLLVPLLRDRDSLTQATVAFALGQIGDTTATAALIGRARDAVPVSEPAVLELITAVARLGGPTGAGFIAEVLNRSLFSGRVDQPYIIARAALESWRLGKHAPVNALLGLATEPKEEIRFGAIYSLGRLRAAGAAPRMLDALRDRNSPDLRAAAARSLTRTYVDSAGISADAVADALGRALSDTDAGTRVNALRSLATFKQSRTASRVVPLTEDPNTNVQVQAVMALGEIGGPEAVTELKRLAAGGKGSWARRRETVLALAATDSAAFAAVAPRWAAAGDWRDRATVATASARFGAAALKPFIEDRDPKVVAVALEAWNERVKEEDPDLITAGRTHLLANDAAVRSVAAGIVGRARALADVPQLVTAYQRASRDSFPDAALAALTALNGIGEVSPEAREAVDRAALAGLGTSAQDYLIRDWAEQNWPAIARVWGGAFPLQTGRSMEDYREIVRRFVLPSSQARYPRVTVEVDQLGTIELELFGPEAPLTVANFLRLVSRRYFDGLRFHRVVPNFVAQTGDPRGDGMGGPGGAIRDEINRRRYRSFIVGMALSGPDTGGSQWFITLSPQPHLDGTYTVFGRVNSGEPVLLRLTQGDLIRTIRP